jgi:hypothetical protein
VESKDVELSAISFGEILSVDVRNDAVGEGKVASLSKIHPVGFSPIKHGYFTVGEPFTRLWGDYG